MRRATLQAGDFESLPLFRGGDVIARLEQACLLEAGNYIATIEHRQGLKVACLEEVALRMGFITQTDLAGLIDSLPKGEYREYLKLVCDEGSAPAAPR